MSLRARAMAAVVAASCGWLAAWLGGLLYTRPGHAWWGVGVFAASGVFIVGAVLTTRRLCQPRRHEHEWRAAATHSGGPGVMAGMGTGPALLGSTVVVWRCAGCTGPESVTTSTIPGRFAVGVFRDAPVAQQEPATTAAAER